MKKAHFLTVLLLVAVNHVALGGEALRSLRQKATDGDRDAQFELARRLDAGFKVEPSASRAAYWYRKAADQNLAQAQYQLGRKYSEGDGVQSDVKEAVRYFRLAAGQDYALAQNRLGRCYELGQGVKLDLVEAYKWYSLAARDQTNIFAVVNRQALARRMSEADIIEAQLRTAPIITSRR